MARPRRRAGAVLAAAVMTVSLTGVGVATAPMALAASGTTLHVAITGNGMYVNGPRTFPAGRVTLFMDAAGGDRGVEIIRLHKGYSFRDFRGDLKVAFGNLFAPGGDTAKGLKALNRAIDNTTSLGGLYAPDGQVRHGSVLLTHPGNRYVLFDDSGNLPRRPVHLTVTAAHGPQVLPATTATVIARTARRWGGDAELPHNGNIKFANHATNSPHFLELQHVKEGTTRQQVLDSFQSPDPPDFLLPGSQDTDVLSPGQAMSVHLNLPAGEYVEMCFFPDPTADGMGTPHALMGMVRVVHLT